MQMNKKRPYDHLLKNLFHEQATEIIPLLLPDYRVEEVLSVEMPDLESIPVDRPPTPFEEGIVGLIEPEAKVERVFKTRWIEHSGNFECTYRVWNTKTETTEYLLIECQNEREDEELSRRLLANFASVSLYVEEEEERRAASKPKSKSKSRPKAKDEAAEGEQKGTIMPCWVNPMALCPFPQGVPKPIREEFRGQVMLAFNFEVLGLWERDAREFLNKKATAIYYLLPVMKNADASLLGLAIGELARRFQDDELELGRHLTGLNLLLQLSETMAEEEKLAAQVHLKPFAHLLKDDPLNDQ